MMGTKKAYPNAVSGFVDVQDVARAHVLVSETPAAHGRYLCIGEVVHRSEFVQNDERALPTVSNYHQVNLSPQHQPSTLRY
jgi:cinnamoyl-CoA reductase